MNEEMKEAIKKLLAMFEEGSSYIQPKELEEKTRYYLSSEHYGTSTYHIVSNRYDGIQITQEDDSKYPPRIKLSHDQRPALLQILLQWHLQSLEDAEDAKELGDVDDSLF